MWNNSILRNSPGNARPTHRQFKAASSPYYPHAKKHLTQVSSSLFASCHFCCCSFLACAGREPAAGLPDASCLQGLLAGDASQPRGSPVSKAQRAGE